MNERIKKLAEQAGCSIDGMGYGEGNVEKFAQLIVRECVKVCNSRVGNSDYNTGRMHCASDLKQHFGIEE